ncbi:DUF2207 domain-containing protein [Bacillus haynesii]|uniref:DUF2207 domain-containing protein n=1 Tax=Bacillus haynesii TaxID=1925021 RepID=UPI002281AEDA|nr:DUF2207 domain-containing protein [Bacillus haynesii]MCY7861760.1 DUF2207 domain-containing protein [Bacillus haynesii]MCY7911619.1 DUF2207 domain-containing protein [Bacillus haynesii]MCY7925622.1 DUF2207 domain-containing protein [Bacillus haynesii]MCY8774081.1 DUF2207 domain-containing protein [Bacillus haynesii]MCY9152301.1 DUF2207 domain-containing protein [Bacillus haynesii]
MKHSFFFFMIIAFFLVTGFSEAGKSFSIERADIRATVKENGDLSVEEVYRYDFKGSFEGATRSFSEETASRLKNFKAYLLPDHQRKGDQAIPLKTKKEDGTYFAYSASKDETKHVMFRYVIEDAAQKFEDTSILIHSFYEKANTDFGRVKIEVRLPESVRARDIHAFLREKGNGKITKVNDSSVTYETGLYRAGTGSELRIYFPQSALKEAVRHPSYQTKDELLKEERDEAKRYAERDERIAGAERMILIFSGIVGFMVIMAVMLSFLKKRRRVMLSFEELESFDPVLVAFLYKKGRFTDRDLLAGMLSLYQRGLVTMRKVQAEERFLDDPKAPDDTYQFEFSGSKADLPKSDQLLIEKLFEQTGSDTYMFRLDSLSGPTEEECKHKEQLGKYERKRIILQNVVQKWTESVRQAPEFRELFQENRWLRMLSLSLLSVHTGLLLFILYADVVHQAGFMAACVIFGFALSAGIVLAKSKLYTTLFLAGLFLASVFTDSVHTILYYGICVGLSILLIAFIPAVKENRYASICRRSILSWRNHLRKEDLFSGRSLSQNEKTMIYAIVLEVEDESTVWFNQSANRLDYASPVLGMAAAGCLHYPFYSWQLPASQQHAGAYDAGGPGAGGGDGAGAF